MLRDYLQAMGLERRDISLRPRYLVMQLRLGMF
jgi:hypothetical protein